MKTKKNLIYVLALVLALAFVGCSQQEQTFDPDIDREIDIGLDAYGGVISVLEEDFEGNTSRYEFDAMGVLGATGEPIVNAFTSSGFSDIVPVKEGDEFEGWMECAYDEDLECRVIVSETLYSTEELLAMPVPEEPVEYYAKWASIAMEDYFNYTIDDSIEDAYTSGIFALCGNGGRLSFISLDDYTYESVGYGYGLDIGQTLNDVMGTEYCDSLTGMSKDGAEFTGWTLYMAESIFWSDEHSEADDILTLVYDEDIFYGTEYVLLRNATVVGENMSTEELCGITCNGENYLAMANWSESETPLRGSSTSWLDKYNEVVSLRENFPDKDLDAYNYWLSVATEEEKAAYKELRSDIFSNTDFRTAYLTSDTELAAELAEEAYNKFMDAYNTYMTERAEFLETNAEEIAAYKAELEAYENSPEVKYPSGTIYFENGAGFTVKFEVNYLDISGTQHSYDTGKIRLGSSDQLSFPVGTHNIEISCRAWNGSSWKDAFFERTYESVPDGYTFKPYATIFNPKIEIITD